jgi:hypothetical protein
MISALEKEYCLRNEIPLPTEPPHERLRLMSAFRPGHVLYRHTCAKTGKPLLSAVPPSRDLVIYDSEVWLGSEWDPREYGRDYNFDRPFFEQFAELMRVVPLPSLSGTLATLENCSYANYVTAARNCYLVFSAQQIEDCMYGRFLYHSRDVVDCFYVRHSELCYGSRDLHGCYNLHFSEHCRNCSDSFFLSACRSCKNCFECVNLANKEFCWRNEQLSETEWRKRRAAVDLGDADVLAERISAFRLFVETQPVRCVFGDRYENSSGNFLNQVADCSNCRIVSESESLADCIWVNKSKSCILTLGFGSESELLYNSTGVGNHAYNLKWCLQCREGVRDLEYCFQVEAGSHDCFGSISIRNGSYCILNKQYSRDEYFPLVEKIKTQMRSTGEYGKFFPAELCPYAYNESDGALFFPIERSEAEQLGFHWSEQDGPIQDVAHAELPKQIEQAGDEILGQAFVCTRTGKPYRILQKELELLRSIRVALPRISPFARLQLAGTFLQWQPLRTENCAQCGTSCTTSVDSRRKILCENCYQELVV